MVTAKHHQWALQGNIITHEALHQKHPVLRLRVTGPIDAFEGQGEPARIQVFVSEELEGMCTPLPGVVAEQVTKLSERSFPITNGFEDMDMHFVALQRLIAVPDDSSEIRRCFKLVCLSNERAKDRESLVHISVRVANHEEVRATAEEHIVQVVEEPEYRHVFVFSARV